MSQITLYGNSCKTKEQYEKDGFSIIENSDGTVSLYAPNLDPLTYHETKPCCELLGYTFDIENQKCRWALDNEELFKVVLNPEGNSSTLFSVDENETCSLEISFDYLFVFNCDDLRNTRAKINNIPPNIQSGIDKLETALNDATVQYEFYKNIIDNANEVPYVVECLNPILYNGLDPNINNYCLTETGLIQWEIIIGADNYTKWFDSNGTDTETYTCSDVQSLVNAQTTPGVYYTQTCDYTIYDKEIANKTIQENNAKLEYFESKKTQLETQISDILETYNATTNNTTCSEYIDMFEQFDTAFTIEVLNTDTNKLVSVYEEPLLNIGSGNLYNYIDTASGKTGIIISGETGLMPTYQESKTFGLNDLCSLIRDNLVSNLFNQYLIDNESPATEKEKEDLNNKLTGWYQSCWLQYSTTISDPDLVSLIENKEINITISIKNTCVDFSILLDRIKLNKVCTKVDNIKRYISEPPKFELTKVVDNKKSWLANTEADKRFFDLKYRGTEYNTNHHRLVVNTKEVDLNLSPSRAVEQDVWTFINDNNGILEGCLGAGESYDAFSCPTGYTLDIDGDSCSKFTNTGTTASTTTYTIGSSVGLTRDVHYLSRGTIFVEDVTDKVWPIFWTGTSKDVWVGPYYNTDYLTDSSGNYLVHTGFGQNNYTDGSLKYSSPDAFSGINSKFGKSSEDKLGFNLNPNIIWGGTNAVVSGSSFVNITGTLNAGRLLNASIWSNPSTLPIGEWIGVSYCLDLPETKTYRIGFAGDDNVRVKINGKYLINPELTPDYDININKNFSTSYSRSIQAYVVMGITLSSGKNIIEVEGYNVSESIAGFVLEVYDATEEELKNIRYESELNSVRIFSTLDRIGQTFDLGENSGYSCPTGYALDTCGTGTTCVLIERVTRQKEQLNDYCPCPGYPQIVKNYENVTIELPLSASTNILDCNDITTLVNDFTGTTTFKDVEIVKGRAVYVLGTGTTTTFDGFWFAEENDGTIGVYEVDWVSGSTNTFDNVSNQVTSGCCQVIDSMFQTYSDTFLQGINNYPSLNWDPNTNKCVYTKCGDNGCTNLDDLLTTDLSEINTVHEFRSILSSELIDAKNRQTISSYPTLRMLYDRYNNRPEEFTGNLSSKFDYFDMDKFGKTVGSYWIDLIEQVIPATTIWGSTYTYRNTVFDQQKYNYRNSNLYFCQDPSPNFPMSAISSDMNVSVITTTLNNNTTGNTNTTLVNDKVECNGVYIINKGCNSEFLGTVKIIEKTTGI